MLGVAEKFFWPCDEGKGWDSCKEYCHPNATFKTDADTLVHLDRLEDYVECLKDAHSMLANAKFEIESIAEDIKRGRFCCMLSFMQTTFWAKNPNQSKMDYVYAMTFKENKIHHITKIWYLNI